MGVGIEFLLWTFGSPISHCDTTLSPDNPLTISRSRNDGRRGEEPSSGGFSGLTFAFPIVSQPNHVMLERSSTGCLCELEEPQIGCEAGPNRSGRMAMRKIKPPQTPIPTLF